MYWNLSEALFIADVYADVYRVSLMLESRLLENKYLKSASYILFQHWSNWSCYQTPISWLDRYC